MVYSYSTQGSRHLVLAPFRYSQYQILLPLLPMAVGQSAVIVKISGQSQIYFWDTFHRYFSHLRRDTSWSVFMDLCQPAVYPTLWFISLFSIHCLTFLMFGFSWGLSHRLSMASQSNFLIFLDLNTKKKKIQTQGQDFSNNKPGTTHFLFRQH